MIEEKLNLVTRPNFYVRIDAKHSLNLYIGRDENFNPSLEFRGNFVLTKLKETNLINITQFKSSLGESILRFSLTDSNDVSLFYIFCNDIVNITRNIPQQEGFSKIVRRFNDWKKFFFTNFTHVLSENSIIGLIGELLFLKNILSKKIGYEKALESWSGQDLTHKDFSYNDFWYEIKTKFSSNGEIKISSLEQLESDNIGYLVSYKLEKMSDKFNGLTINKLIEQIILELKDEELIDEFKEKISKQGYIPNLDYDKFVYNESKCIVYKVDENFPKLRNVTLDNSIIKVSYSLDEYQLVDYVVEEIEV